MRSALGGIGDTIAVGCVLYKENITNFTIVPFGDIHVFIGETAA